MRQPSPEQRLRHVAQLAHFDGLSLLAIATPATVAALVTHEWATAGIGAGVVCCGLLELAGRRRLIRRVSSGLVWMASAQLFCLTLILGYAWLLAHQETGDHILRLLPAFTRAQLAELFPDPEAVNELILGVQRLMAAAVALVSLLFQGGMALYYLHTRRAAAEAFATPPVLDLVPSPPR